MSPTHLEHVSGQLWRDPYTGCLEVRMLEGASPIGLVITQPMIMGDDRLLKIRVEELAAGATVQEISDYLGTLLWEIWTHFEQRKLKDREAELEGRRVKVHFMLNLQSVPPEWKRPICNAFLRYFEQEGRRSMSVMSVVWEVGNLNEAKGFYRVERTAIDAYHEGEFLDFVGTPLGKRNPPIIVT